MTTLKTKLLTLLFFSGTLFAGGAPFQVMVNQTVVTPTSVTFTAVLADQTFANQPIHPAIFNFNGDTLINAGAAHVFTSQGEAHTFQVKYSAHEFKKDDYVGIAIMPDDTSKEPLYFATAPIDFVAPTLKEFVLITFIAMMAAVALWMNRNRGLVAS